MAGDDKKETSPAPSKETPSKGKDEGARKGKGASGADPANADGAEAAGRSPSGYSRGERQKPISKAYRDNWDVIFARKKK